METLIAITLLILTLAVINHKLGRIAHALERTAVSAEKIADVELPILSAFISEPIEPQLLDICNPN